jgi:HEAT repeat protein
VEVLKLIADLRDENLKVRFDAAKALGELRHSTAFEALVAVLNDYAEHSHVRGQAAIALGRIGDVRAFAPLMQSLKDEDAHVAGNAKVAVMTLIVAMPADAVPYLIETLADEAEEQRTWAADTLGYYINYNFTLAPLLDALRDKRPAVQLGAIQALSYYDTPEVIHTLLNTLQDESPKMRYNVALALGEIGNSAVLAELKASEAHDPDNQVRTAAAYAIQRIKDLR